MGSGRSPVGGGGGKVQQTDFPQAYTPDPKDWWDSAWADYEASFGDVLTDADNASIGGYVSSGNSFAINEYFYNEKKGGYDAMSDKDKATVDALDGFIDSHRTPADARYTRYVDEDAVASLLGMDYNQKKMFLSAINQAKAGDTDMLNQLNKTVSGSKGYSASYTSTTAAKEHIFDRRDFRREISVPAKTKALATNKNEHEVIFGREMNTVVTGISLESLGISGRMQVVIHEKFVGYGKSK